MKIAMKYFRDNYENHNDISSDNYENHNEISSDNYEISRRK